jgi:Kef-type K+ transport system membrane component KefB
VSATRGKSMQARGLDALSLVVIVGILYAATRVAPGRRDTATVVGGLGFLLLAGTLTSQLLEMLRLPHLTGYLLAGVIAGPHALRLVDAVTVRQLAPVNTLALALIALAGGAELSAAEVRRSAKSLTINLLFQSVIVVVGVGGLFVLASPLIPFTRGLPLTSVVAIALLWGILATARSPSAALGILAQTRARGPLASFSVAFVMLSDVGVLVLAAAGILLAHSLLDPTATLSMSSMYALGHELVGSVSIGTTLGLMLSVYLRMHGKQLVVVLLALGFGATEVLHYLRFEPLLCFLTAGFVVRNLSKQGDKLAHAIEDMGSTVYVVFFAIAGASLAIPLLVALWPVALLLAVARAAITTGAGRLAGRFSGDDPMVRRWGWTTLIAQAGLTQGLANVLAREFPDFGEPLRALVFASVALNSVVGPILFKMALDRARESREQSPSLPSIQEPA